MILRPVRITEEEARYAVENAQNEVRTLNRIGVLLLAISVLFAWLAYLQSKAVLLDGVGIIAVSWFLVSRQSKREHCGIPLERRFKIKHDGLEIEVLKDNLDSSRTEVKWKDVWYAKQTDDSVVLKLRSGGSQSVPYQCFANDEQRRAFIALASPSSLRS